MSDLKQNCLKLAVQIKSGGNAEDKAMGEMEQCLRTAGYSFIRHRLSGIWERRAGLDEDVFRDAIGILYQKIKNNGIDNIPGYFHIILRNKCADIINQLDREEILNDEIYDRTSSDNPYSDEIDLLITINECIKQWKKRMPRQWEIFELHFVQGFKFREIATQLHKGLSAIKVSSSRFLEKVRQCVEE